MSVRGDRLVASEDWVNMSIKYTTPTGHSLFDWPQTELTRAQVVMTNQ